MYQKILLILTIALLPNCLVASEAVKNQYSLELELGNNPIKLIEDSHLLLQKNISEQKRLDALFTIILAKESLSRVFESSAIKQVKSLAIKLNDSYKICALKIVEYKHSATLQNIAQELAAKKAAEQCVANAESKDLESRLIETTGSIMGKRGSYTEAIKLYNKAYNLVQELELKRREFYLLLRLAYVYFSSGDPELALPYLEEAEKLLLQNPRSQDQGVLEYAKGLYHLQMGDFEQAIIHTKNTKDIALKINNFEGLVSIYYQLTSINFQQNKFSEALDFANEAVKLAELYGYNLWLNRLFLLQAEIYLNMENVQSASNIILLLEGMIKPRVNQYEYLSLLQLKVDVAKSNNRFEEAFLLLSDKVSFSNKLFADEKSRNHKEMMFKFNYERQEADKLLLKEKNRAQTHKIAKQKNEKIMYFSISFVLALLLVLVVFGYIKEKVSKQRIAILARTDELTGSYNRRYILKLLTQERERSIRYKVPLSVAMVDLDFFKKINDNYGHTIGDKVLKLFSVTCEKHLRSEDNFGRIGGEEWLLVFPHTNAENAMQICQRVADAFRKVNIEPIDYPITFSAGLVTFHGSDLDIEQLIHQADEALYKAKGTGRNKCVIYED